MKKWLLLFVVVDFLFVGLVLRFSTQNERRIASVQSGAELTEGQMQKYELVKSLNFTSDNDNLILKTDKLQLLCDTSSLVDLKFVALHVAVAGAQPSINHTFSCFEIKKDLSLNILKTSIADFKSMQKANTLSLPASAMKASQVYSDEDFPTEWQLSEIKVTGPHPFIINQYEIEKVHPASQFGFKITSVE